MVSREQLAAREVAIDLALRNGKITADDLRDYLPHLPKKRAFFGCALRSLVEDGQLEVVGTTNSRHPGNHGRRIQVYRVVT